MKLVLLILLLIALMNADKVVTGSGHNTRVESRRMKTTTVPMSTPNKEIKIPEPKTNRTTLALENSENSDSWISNFSKIMENFLKALMSAGKSNGVVEAARTTVQPAGI
ncbi:hypothetical protein L3Y34_005436 [Caenorhabditis briggsae]|uniref:Uncharacterized protein n=1 Tax=Caenorhabditis briggsae TaxID=6238 RepID=A0AAE9D789_CAEBR|nr:hypothetical protein L3Y34_005436 [Caenorhabditis briggsae]